MVEQNDYIYIYPVESLGDSRNISIFDSISYNAVIVTFYPEVCSKFERDKRLVKVDFQVEPITEYPDGKNPCQFLIHNDELDTLLSHYKEHIDNVGVYDGKSWKLDLPLFFVPFPKLDLHCISSDILST